MDMQYIKLRKPYKAIEEIRCTIHYKGGKTYRIIKKTEHKQIIVKTLELQNQGSIDYVTIANNNIYDIPNANWSELVDKAIMYEHDELAEIKATCLDTHSTKYIKHKCAKMKVSVK